MQEIRLRDDEVAAIQLIIEDLAEELDTVESAEFQRRSRVYADHLPQRVRLAVNDFRLQEPAAALLVTGWPVEDDQLGATPTEAGHKPVPSPSLQHDLAFFLFASLLGDPIGWATQQDGYLMHDVYPVRDFEHAQIGWGSAELLSWHTEDAFHPLRTDYLGLLCLRNPDAVTTTLADVADLVLEEEHRAILAQDRFHFLPDDSHRLSDPDELRAEGRVGALRRRSLDRVERALHAPESAAILFGDPDDPYLRLDPYYMKSPEGQAELQAFERICAAVDAALNGVVLQPGNMIFIDNYRAVHGRKPFRARFDGTDRWLRRLNVVRDLRRSRASRLSPDSRVIY